MLSKIPKRVLQKYFSSLLSSPKFYRNFLDQLWEWQTEDWSWLGLFLKRKRERKGKEKRKGKERKKERKMNGGRNKQNQSFQNSGIYLMPENKLKIVCPRETTEPFKAGSWENCRQWRTRTALKSPPKSAVHIFSELVALGTSLFPDGGSYLIHLRGQLTGDRML